MNIANIHAMFVMLNWPKDDTKLILEIAIYVLNDGIAKVFLFINFSNGRLNIAYLKNNNKMH